jgi:hypothetical protein
MTGHFQQGKWMDDPQTSEEILEAILWDFAKRSTMGATEICDRFMQAFTNYYTEPVTGHFEKGMWIEETRADLITGLAEYVTKKVK